MYWLVEFIFFLAIAIPASLAYFAWSRRYLAGAQIFTCLMLALTLWAFSTTISLYSVNIQDKYFWTRLAYVGILTVPTLWLLLTLQYTRQKQWTRPGYIILMVIEPIALLVLIWTQPLPNLFWRDIAIASIGNYSTLAMTRGPFFWVNVFYSYGVLALSTILLIKGLQRSTGLYRSQIVALVICGFSICIGNVLYLLGYFPNLRIDPTPFIFALASPLLGLGLLHFRMLDIVPVAHDAVIESMDDGIVILDARNRVVATNPAADRILGWKEAEVIGLPAEMVLSAWPGLLAWYPGRKTASRSELALGEGKEKRYFDLRLSPVKEYSRNLTGMVIVIHEITSLKQSEEALQRRAEELAALHATLLDITASHDLPTLLHTITERATRLLNAGGGELYLCDPERGEVRCVVNHNVPNLALGSVLRYGEGAAGTVAQTGNSLIIDDYESWPARIAYSGEDYTTAGLISAPLVWQDRVNGVIIVLDINEGRRFSEDDLELLTMLANQASIAIENTRLYEGELRRAHVIETLLDISETIGTTIDFQQVIKEIDQAAGSLLPVDRVGFFLWDEVENILKPVLPHPGSLMRLRLTADQVEQFSRLRFKPDDLPLFHELQHSLKAIAVEDALHSPLLPPDMAEFFNIKSLLVIPLFTQHQFLGVLYLDCTYQPHKFTSGEIDLASALARQTALALERAQLFGASQRRAQESETLRQAMATVAATLSQDEAIERILEQLALVVPYDSASVQLLRDGNLEIVGGRGWSEPGMVVGLRFPVPGDNPNTRVIQDRRPYILDDARSAFLPFREQPHNHIESWLGVPLMVRDVVIGMLSVDSKKPNYFKTEHARLASAFADQVAIAIENARLFTGERKRVKELDALRATIADISSELKLPKLLQAILERAIALLGATGGELGIIDDKSHDLVIAASYKMGKDNTGTHISSGEGAMGRVIETEGPVIVNNYMTWEGRSPQYLQNGPWHAALAVPLMIGGKLVGSLAIVHTDPARQFSESDQHLLSSFAQQAAIAVENARLYQEAREAAERRAILHQVSQEVVAASLDPEGIYYAIHQAGAQLMPCEAFVITLLDEKEKICDGVYLVDHSGRVPAQCFPIEGSLSGRVISTGQSIYIEDILEVEDQVQTVKLGDPIDVRSILAVPMRLGGKVIGMLSAQSYQPYIYTSEDQHLLEMLASYAAIALENARLFREVQKLAITDSLTGVFNRRQLFELGQREFSRTVRFGRPLSTILLDIDRFKSVNDTYGHATGDEVLRAIIRRIQENVREIDTIGRYGGEEFVVILPETDCKAALIVAERIRACVGEVPIPTTNGEVRVTLSLGIAEITADTADFARLVARADAAMYDAKKSGRNRVEVR